MEKTTAQTKKELQKIFDKAYLGIVNQGCLGKTDADGGCHYRHPDNPAIRCAVGHLIPDDKYEHSMEGRRAFFICRDYISLGLFDYRTFVDELQRVHDRAVSIEHFKSLAKAFALQFDLTVSQI